MVNNYLPSLDGKRKLTEQQEMVEMIFASKNDFLSPLLLEREIFPEVESIFTPRNDYHYYK